MAYKALKTKRLQNYRSAKNYPVFLTNNTMKKLSEIYKELGIAFIFPIEITDSNDRVTYFEDSTGVKKGTTQRAQLEALGDKIKDAGLDSADYNGNQTYYEDSAGTKRVTPKSAKTCEGKVVEVDGIKYELKAL